MLSAGFKQNYFNYSLMIKKSDKGIVIVLIYVDDLLIIGSSMKLIDDTKQILKNNFKIKDLGAFRYFLGIEFAKNAEGIIMHQRKYAFEIIAT